MVFSSQVNAVRGRIVPRCRIPPPPKKKTAVSNIICEFFNVVTGPCSPFFHSRDQVSVGIPIVPTCLSKENGLRNPTCGYVSVVMSPSSPCLSRLGDSTAQTMCDQ
jgi:hypothetical protein